MQDKKYVYFFIIKASLFFFFNIPSVTWGQQAKKENIQITTMNIAWYGNTKFHTKDIEQRDLLIKEFIESELKTTEIFLFQEITKPEHFEQILNSKFKCAAYDFRGYAHQYVLTCYDSTKFEITDKNENLFNPDRTIFISDPKDRLRDVLEVSLKSKQTGHIINTYNLHLKAGIEAAEIRKVQTALLLQNLKNKNIPSTQTVIIGGDFNSYIRNIEGQKESEIDTFLNLSDDFGFDFYTVKNIPTTLAYTQKIFDFLMIETKNVITDYIVHPICKKTQSTVNQLEDYLFFKENISDHCPVTTSLKVIN